MLDLRRNRLRADQQARLEFWLRGVAVITLTGLFILLGTLALAFETLVSTQDSVQLAVDDVADQDILAPRSLTYNSEVLTEQARQDATEAVEPVYDPNPDVTRAQIRLAGAVKNYITEVRQDTYASDSQLLVDLSQIDTLSLDNFVWQSVLDLPDNRWELVGNEVTAVVERTMQSDIRPDNLDSVRNNLVNTVASRFSGAESAIVVAIAEDLIQPNTFFNAEATELREQEAAAKVTTQERRFEEGQIIVRGGTLVTDLEIEALRQFGFLQPEDIRLQAIVGAMVVMILITIMLDLYLRRFHTVVRYDPKMLGLVGALFIVFLMGVHLFGDEGVSQPYLYPSAAMALLMTSLFSAELAIVAISLLAVLVGIAVPGTQSLELATLVLVGGITGVLSLPHIERFNSYFVAGLIIGLANMVVVIAFAMKADETPAIAEVIADGIIALANGLFAAGIALVAMYAITNALNLTTSLKLIELIDSKNVLLQRLLREAPGTYQHSLQVGNLSELAAESIGANSQLVRVAAMYHDIGKMLNPYYFGENTTDGMNPHEDLNDPQQSAKVIIGHVIEGERLARRHNLPARIRNFINEHHGTTQVLFFYNKAVERAGGDEDNIDIKDFTYPGPPPQSRETAIMMLADGCESATRSKRPSSKSDIEEMVNTIFELRLSEGQLDESGLTLNDLKTIRRIFIETLQAMYHPRIAYTTRRKSEDKAQLNSGIVKHLESGTDSARKTRTDSDKIPPVKTEETSEASTLKQVDKNG